MHYFRLLHQSNPPGQQFLHHPLLQQPGFVTLPFQCCDPGIHVGEDGGNGGLFGERWSTKLERPDLSKIQPLPIATSLKTINLFLPIF